MFKERNIQDSLQEEKLRPNGILKENNPRLPKVFFDVGIELDGLLPAIADDSLTDVLLVFWGYGLVAAVVFVITLAVEVVDEVLLQGVGYALRHVIIDLRNTERHADGLVVTVHGTRISLHSRIIEVDTRIDATVFRRVVLQLPAQAARPHGTGL